MIFRKRVKIAINKEVATSYPKLDFEEEMEFKEKYI